MGFELHSVGAAPGLRLSQRIRQIPWSLVILITMVASIGPTTSEELSRHGVRPDFEPSHGKMGFLVKEAAERSAGILRQKRAETASA